MNLQGDSVEPARRGGPLITSRFEDVWPDVERHLRALLYRRGLDQTSADDVVQEVALRVLANGVTFEDAADLLRWAAPVACRLHVDLLRHRARMTDEDEVSGHPARDDVAGEVADRLELQRALRAIAALRPADREAIIDAVAADQSVPRDRQEAVRLAVRRHRARTRLAVALQQLAALVAGWAATSRLLMRDRRAPVVAALVPAAAALPLMVAFGPSEPMRPHLDRRAPALSAPAPRAPLPVTGTVSRPGSRAGAKAPASTGAVAARPGAVRPAEPDELDEPAEPVGPAPIDVDGPGGVGVTGGTSPQTTDDRKICLRKLPEAGDICLL